MNNISNLLLSIWILFLVNDATSTSEQMKLLDGFELKADEFDSLTPNFWLFNKIIDYAICHVIDQRAKIFGVQFAYMNSFASTFTINNLPPITPSSIFATVDMNEKQVIMPYCFKDSHWCLMIADMKTRQFEYYDPMLPDFASIKDKVKELLNRFLIILGKRNELVSAERRVNTTNWTIKKKPSVIMKKQTPNDCGIYVIMFVDHLINGKFTFKDGDDYRRNIRNTILERYVALQNQQQSTPPQPITNNNNNGNNNDQNNDNNNTKLTRQQSTKNAAITNNKGEKPVENNDWPFNNLGAKQVIQQKSAGKPTDKHPLKNPVSNSGETKNVRNDSPLKRASDNTSTKSNRNESPLKKMDNSGSAKNSRNGSPLKKMDKNKSMKENRNGSPLKKMDKNVSMKENHNGSPLKKMDKNVSMKENRNGSPLKKIDNNESTKNTRKDSPLKKIFANNSSKNNRNDSPLKKMNNNETTKNSNRNESPWKKIFDKGLTKNNNSNESPLKKMNINESNNRKESPLKKMNNNESTKDNRNESPLKKMNNNESNNRNESPLKKMNNNESTKNNHNDSLLKRMFANGSTKNNRNGSPLKSNPVANGTTNNSHNELSPGKKLQSAKSFNKNESRSPLARVLVDKLVANHFLDKSPSKKSNLRNQNKGDHQLLLNNNKNSNKKVDKESAKIGKPTRRVTFADEKENIDINISRNVNGNKKINNSESVTPSLKSAVKKAIPAKSTIRGGKISSADKSVNKNNQKEVSSSGSSREMPSCICDCFSWNRNSKKPTKNNNASKENERTKLLNKEKSNESPKRTLKKNSSFKDFYKNSPKLTPENIEGDDNSTKQKRLTGGDGLTAENLNNIFKHRPNCCALSIDKGHKHYGDIKFPKLVE